jgi:hypothetical protein
MGTCSEHIANIGREFIIEFNNFNLPMYDISDDIPDNFYQVLIPWALNHPLMV